ncbi:dUTP diphosphatase [Macrococcus brunensis]|uniref:dUTP diphosphatase n=1 Tax=Macrococcus brunensis TaxID=198483 RepID=UPI001EF0DFE3|nr:dUTP diphosphatase [Macrococcus brunensis]ULG73204.1 dUTP diphosphatase [Macrococcus brunensis]
MQSINIKLLSENATAPTRAHEHDAGLDLYASEDTDCYIFAKTKIPTGIAVEIPLGYEGQIRPRSGMTLKTPINVFLGTIDSGYTGELGVIAQMVEEHYLDETSGNTGYTIKKGDKIAQLVISPIVTPAVNIVEEFESETARGDRGFGSTGY